MEKQAKVSIIVPVYNAEDYIKKCISSICTQSVSELQIILVDDGSTDNSLEICRQLQKNDNRIEVFHQENQGASAARNKGMQLANAEWVMFVDSDDWLEENAVQTLCEEASHADSDIIMGMIVNNYSFSDEDAAVMKKKVYRYDMAKYRVAFWGGCTIEPQVFASVFPEKMKHLPFLGSPCAKIYRRELLQKSNAAFLDNIHYGEDTLFNMEVLSMARSVYYVSAPVYHYRMRAGSLSTGKIEDKYKQYIDYVKESENSIRRLRIPQSEEFLTYRSLDLVQMIWELAEIYGMAMKSLRELSAYKKLLKSFSENTACKKAMEHLKLEQLPDKKHKLMVAVLKRRMYAVSICACGLFYKVFASKKRI